MSAVLLGEPDPAAFDWAAIKAAVLRYPALAEALPLFARHQQATLDLALVLRILEERGGHAEIQLDAPKGGASKSRPMIEPAPAKAT